MKLKFLLYFLSLPLLSFGSPFYYPPTVDSSEEIKLNEEFRIKSRQKPPQEYRCWTNEEKWELLPYTYENVELISFKSIVLPDAYGGDLYQYWKLKAYESGTFDFIFYKLDEEITVTVLIP